MIEKVILTKVFISEKSKEGVPFVSKKTGKPFKKIGIMTTKHGEAWLSAFINSSDDLKNNWKVGDEVQVVVEKNGDWLNFTSPTNFDILKEKHYQLEDRVKLLEQVVNQLKSGVVKPQELPTITQDEQADIDSIPF